MIRIIFLMGLLFSFSANAAGPGEALDDPILEERARGLTKQLRCVVCQNQSIDESNADIAKSLRLLVRERLVAGDTNGQVLDYAVARYGEFVLLRPRIALHTLLLWISPLLFILLGVFLARRLTKSSRQKESVPEGLTEAEEEALAKIRQK